MSNLNLLADIASRAPEEIEAAEALLELNKEQSINLEAAAITILDLNRLPVPPEAKEILKEFFIHQTPESIAINSKHFIDYGILPPIEIVADEIEGGDKRKITETRDVREERERLEELRRVKQAENERISERNKRQSELDNWRKTLPKDAVDTFTGKSFEDLSIFLQRMDVCQPNRASLLMKALFPPAAVDIWTKAMKKNCRDIYEPGGIETQCNNTILPVNREKDLCYICGFKFYSGVDDPEISQHILEVREGVEPTCEHILPIIQAIFFLDLFRQSEKGKISSDKMAILKKEYAWTHRCCNYVKRDDSFLVTKISQKSLYPSWGFNAFQTNKTLLEIFNTRDYPGSGIIQKQILTFKKEKWLKYRLEYIRDKKMEDIINHINSKGNGGIVMMMGYSNCVDTTKINDKFSRVIDQLRLGETSETSVATTNSLHTEAPAPQGRGRTYRMRKNKKLNKKTRKIRKHK